MNLEKIDINLTKISVFKECHISEADPSSLLLLDLKKYKYTTSNFGMMQNWRTWAEAHIA